jgi:hypothetical protein
MPRSRVSRRTIGEATQAFRRQHPTGTGRHTGDTGDTGEPDGSALCPPVRRPAPVRPLLPGEILRTLAAASVTAPVAPTEGGSRNGGWP